MKSILTYLKLFIAVIFLSNMMACNFAPGSYPYAERYEIKATEVSLIDAVENFKKENPAYNVPAQLQLKDGRSDAKDLWYHVYFYYPHENQIIYTWIRAVNNEKSTFAFVSINEGLELGKWKDINRDFGSNENNENKAKFEMRILNKIKSKFK